MSAPLWWPKLWTDFALLLADLKNDQKVQRARKRYCRIDGRSTLSKSRSDLLRSEISSLTWRLLAARLPDPSGKEPGFLCSAAPFQPFAAVSSG
jgi:hypothetical protein